MTDQIPYSLTPKAKRVVNFASSLASCFSKGEVGTGHILAGECYHMVRGDTEFGLFLASNLTYQNILPLLTKRKNPTVVAFDEQTLESYKSKVKIYFKEDVVEMLKIAQDACRRFSVNYVSSDFLAWSIIQVPESDGEKILRLHGITLDKLTKELEKEYSN